MRTQRKQKASVSSFFWGQRVELGERLMSLAPATEVAATQR
jgi:hypothetical protein